MARNGSSLDEVSLRVREVFLTSDLTIAEMEVHFGFSQEKFLELISRICTPEERKARFSRICSLRKGSKNGNWRGGRRLLDGYYWIPKPDWFTGWVSSNYIQEHIVIYCSAHDLTEIPKGYVVHHKDLDPLNNLVENLILLTTSEHMKLHWIHRRKNET